MRFLFGAMRACCILRKKVNHRAMRIEVSGKQFVFPRKFACCDRYPGTRLVVSGSEKNRKSRTLGWAWDVPYCQQCLAHVKAFDRMLLAALLGFALTGSVSFAGFGLGVAWQACLVGFFATAMTVLLVTFLVYRLLRTRCHPKCYGVTCAVRYLGSSGSWHSFDIRSKSYASEFARANRLKLVNASASVIALLGGLDLNEHQVARRLIRRPK